MDSIGSNVRKLRKEAGWDDPLDAYDATKRLADEKKLKEAVKPSVWINLESRQPGPQGPALRTLQIIRDALSAGLGRHVTIDELIAEHVEGDDAAGRAARTDQGTAARQRRRSGTRRSSRPHRKDGEQ